jgi:RHS repeat-associated protein
MLSNIQYRNKYAPGSFPTVDFNYTQDNSGLIKSITGFTDSIKDMELSNVDYNNDLEIESVQHTLPQPFNETYTYDTRGNRLTSPNQTHTYNNLNQLISTGTHNYEYDADGNMTKETNTVTEEIKEYFYNSENRMYRYEHYPNSTSPADKIATYKYDLYGRRIQKTVDGTVTNFFWEDDNMAMELDVGLNPIRRYIYGVGKDDVESFVEFSELIDPNTGQGTFNTEKKGWYSFVKDQVGTIHKVYSHENEQIVESRDYDTFGNLVNGTTISAGNLGFQSKYYDQESGLYYFYHRYYHPVNGRFINEDPIGLDGGLNMYRFVFNSPINFIDPFGLNPFTNPPESLKLACLLFKKAKFGKSQDEYGGWFYADGTADEEKYWWKPSGDATATVKPPRGTVAGSFHTHPSRDRQGRSRPRAPRSGADHNLYNHHWNIVNGKRMPVYTISIGGIYRLYNQKGKGKGKIRQVMKYKDFKKYCKCHGYW